MSELHRRLARLVIPVLSCLLPLLVGSVAAEERLAGLDEFVEAQMRESKVPGLAIAIVKDGAVLVSRGYGQRDLKDADTVTPNTLFAIGSTTKAFTVATLALLVDEGKLDWDRPVRDYLPDFRLFDEGVSVRITVRDLVTHRSGLPRHDFMWYGSPFSRQQIYDRLRHLEPSKDLRAAFQYQNLMFMVAGYLAGRVSGRTWEDVLRQRILAPLGMTGSTLSVEDSKRTSDHALPYRKVGDDVVEVPFRNIDSIGPAGGLNSSVAEMTPWLLMLLNGGRHDGRQLLSPAAIGEMQNPQTVVSGAGRRAELGPTSYGLGWFLTTYRGRKLVSHEGGIDGFSALVTFMPRERIGMVILANLGRTPLPTVVSYNVYDRLLGLGQIPWSQRLKDEAALNRQSERDARTRGYTARRAGTTPSHEISAYAGEYEHPAYGVVRIEPSDGTLSLGIHGLVRRLTHYHYDVFEVRQDDLNPFTRVLVQFHTSLQGDIESLSMPLEPAVKPVVFARRPEPALRERRFLEPLAGRFALGARTVTVALRGEDTLTLTVPGQPPYDLLPVHDLTFVIKGLTGFSVEFKRDAAGAPNEVVFFQPNGTFLGRRAP